MYRLSYISPFTLPLFMLQIIPSLATQQSQQAHVLIYSATQGFRHDSIPTAIQALKTKQSSINAEFDNTEEQTQFNDEVLSRYDALVFLSTTGEVLDSAGKAAFQKYLDAGGNFIGIHSASDSLVNTTFYGNETGAFFDYHPILQNATVNVIDRSHPSTKMLPAQWHIQEEMYNFKSDPRSLGATVLLSANESSYTDPGPHKYNQGSPHLSAWFQERGAGVESGRTAGRSFYTSLGHLNETWQDDLFLAHIMGGISWALQSNTTRAYNANGQVGNANGPSASPESATSQSPAYIIPYTTAFLALLGACTCVADAERCGI